tara:strand:- start:12584 stop:12916 length:333 start_codon:yes stop_codon:yes gene_type:complete
LTPICHVNFVQIIALARHQSVAEENWGFAETSTRRVDVNGRLSVGWAREQKVGIGSSTQKSPLLHRRGALVPNGGRGAHWRRQKSCFGPVAAQSRWVSPVILALFALRHT